MKEKREHWSSRIGFLFAAAGSAVGLGILWKFPYIVGQNGGSCFLVAYVLCLTFVAFPILMAELTLGRLSRAACVGAFEAEGNPNSPWRISGWFGVLSSFLIMSYYSIIAGWAMSYALMSLNQSYKKLDISQIKALFETLSSSAGITLFWSALFTLICTAIVYNGVRKGIERWSKFMTQALLLILVGLFLYALTLSGLSDAVKFIFYPDFSEFSANSLIQALGLSLFTLSLGQGIMITYGSYLSPSEDIPKMSFIVTAMIIIVGLLASMTIFPAVFTFGMEPQSGYGLVFQTLPYLFTKLPGTLIISTAFFILLVFTAITSAVPLIEVVVANLMEIFSLSRKKASIIVGSSTFIFGIPSALSKSNLLFPEWISIYGLDFFSTIDRLVEVWFLPIGAMLTSIYMGHKIEKHQCFEELFKGSKWHFLFKPWLFFIKWIIPLLILFIILESSGIIDVV